MGAQGASTQKTAAPGPGRIEQGLDSGLLRDMCPVMCGSCRAHCPGTVVPQLLVESGVAGTMSARYEGTMDGVSCQSEEMFIDLHSETTDLSIRQTPTVAAPPGDDSCAPSADCGVGTGVEPCANDGYCHEMGPGGPCADGTDFTDCKDSCYGPNPLLALLGVSQIDVKLSVNGKCDRDCQPEDRPGSEIQKALGLPGSPHADCPGPPGAVKRPQRFPMYIGSLWRFCKGAPCA
jgi:hypothetical protein